MKFLSKVILDLESNLLRIYVEARVDLGCAAPSFCLCVCSICVCLGFVCVKKCLWLCLGICVCAYVYQCHRCQLNICFWVYVNFCSCVGCCVYVCVYLCVCVSIFVCVCVCVLWISSCTCCLCVASVLPLFLFLLQSAAATNCSYRKLKSERMSSRCKTNLAFSYCTFGFWTLCGVLMGEQKLEFVILIKAR